MAYKKRSLARVRWSFGLKLFNAVFSGCVLNKFAALWELHSHHFFTLYALLFSSSVASLILRWGSIVPCMTVGFLFSTLSISATGHGSIQEAVSEAMLFGFFPIAGFVVCIIDDLPPHPH